MPSQTQRQPAKLRRRINELEESKIVEVWQLGLGRKDLIPLWVGESDVVTPKFIADAAADAIKAGHTFYSYKRGEPELRETLAQYINRLHGTPERPQPVTSDRITVTSAGMNGLILVMECIIEEGDELVAVTPVWPNIFAASKIMGGVPVPVPLDLTERGWSLDLDRLFAACGPRTKAMFVNSPGNPSGWVLAPGQREKILEFCRARGIWLIADEVYDRFVYDRPVAPSFLSIAEPEDDLIVVNSFSKAWAMTGWRMGWLVTSQSFGETIGKTVEFNTSGTAPFLQHAGVVAVRDGEPFVKEMVERCRVGRDLVHQALARAPRVRMVRPEASIYAFFKVDGVVDTVQFCKDILTRTGIGLAPGDAFGPGGEGCIRLCFANSAERLSLAMDKLVPALA